MFFFLTRRIFFSLTLCCCIVLQSCATTDKPASEMKVGMHLDAVLEFVVEYPLSWRKDRRLIYDSKEGEVRWTPPDQPNIRLQIKSFIPKPQALDSEQQIDMSLREFVGLQITSKELIDLPAGEAWHMTGHTAQGDLSIYLFLRPKRSYLITFTTPPDQLECCEEVMDRVTRSFQTTPL